MKNHSSVNVKFISLEKMSMLEFGLPLNAVKNFFLNRVDLGNVTFIFSLVILNRACNYRQNNGLLRSLGLPGFFKQRDDFLV